MTRKWELYEVSGESLLRKNRFCPRCGEGVFMAEHGNRFSCGGCGYTEWKEKKDIREEPPKPKEKPAEEPKKEAKAEPKEEPKDAEAKPAKDSKEGELKAKEPAEKPEKKSRKKSK